MAQLVHHRFTFAEYVELEEHSSVRHEYLAGLVFAMAGGTPDHAGISANLARMLGNALEGKPCRVFSPDLRVRVAATGLGSYADVTVVYGKLELDPEDPKGHTVLNPQVWAPATQKKDSAPSALDGGASKEAKKWPKAQ